MTTKITFRIWALLQRRQVHRPGSPVVSRPRFSAAARAAAHNLAVTYHAYLSAIIERDPGGVIVWGAILIEDQEHMGVELLRIIDIRQNIASARADAAQAQEARP